MYRYLLYEDFAFMIFYRHGYLYEFPVVFGEVRIEPRVAVMGMIRGLIVTNNLFEYVFGYGLYFIDFHNATSNESPRTARSVSTSGVSVVGGSDNISPVS